MSEVKIISEVEHSTTTPPETQTLTIPEIKAEIKAEVKAHVEPVKEVEKRAPRVRPGLQELSHKHVEKKKAVDTEAIEREHRRRWLLGYGRLQQ